jgi:hypothetical protein
VFKRDQEDRLWVTTSLSPEKLRLRHLAARANLRSGPSALPGVLERSKVAFGSRHPGNLGLSDRETLGKCTRSRAGFSAVRRLLHVLIIVDEGSTDGSIALDR